MSKRAVICARVSTDKQSEQGRSIPTQLAEMRDYAQREGLSVMAEIADTVSGTIPMRQRPGGAQLYDYIDQKAVDCIVFFTTDRVSRHALPKDVVDLMDACASAGIELHLKDFGKVNLSDPFQVILVLVHWAGAASEHKKIVERTVRGRNAKARAGKIIGAWRAPYGYKYQNDALVIDEKEAAVVRQIFTWYANGDDDGRLMTCAAIRRRLAEMQIVTPSHNTPNRPQRSETHLWAEFALHQILKRETYIGIWRYGKRIGKHGRGGLRRLEDTIAIAVPAIVDRVTWQKAQDRMAEMRRTASSRRANAHQYLLRGMIKCGKCGSAMCADRTTRRCTYRCSWRNHHKGAEGKCDQRQVTVQILEDAVWSRVLDLITDPVKFETRARAAMESERDSLEPRLARLAKLNKLIASCDREIVKIAQDIRTQRGRVKEHLQAQADQLNAQYEELTEERAKIQAQIDAVQVTEQDIAELVAFMRDAADELHDSDWELKREILEMLKAEIVITDDEAEVTIWLSDKHKETLAIALAISKCNASRACRRRA